MWLCRRPHRAVPIPEAVVREGICYTLFFAEGSFGEMLAQWIAQTCLIGFVARARLLLMAVGAVGIGSDVGVAVAGPEALSMIPLPRGHVHALARELLPLGRELGSPLLLC